VIIATHFYISIEVDEQVIWF